MKIVASLKNGARNKSELKFYDNYSAIVFKSLKRPLFQNFLDWILKRENIKKDKIKNVQIMMFPFVKENGNSLAGKCNSKGEVFLYPKKQKSCQKINQKVSSNGFLKYLTGRARATLIHELLHLKYESDEEMVKILTKKYYSIFHKNIGFNQLVLKKYLNMIFKY